MSDFKKIVDEKSYRMFSGADWPSYNDFLNGNFSVEQNIKIEIDTFVQQMQEKYNTQTATNVEELSQANQSRQQQIFFDKNYHGPRCLIPWNTLGINSNGNVYICESPSWIPIFVGNILETDNIFEILNSEKARKIRHEISENRYYYCNNRICGFYNQKNPTTYSSMPPGNGTDPLELIDNPALYVNEIPKEVILDFDYTCNFKCPSCRTEAINWNNDHIRRPLNDQLVEKIKHNIIDLINEQSVNIRWCGGEPFMSDVYLNLFEYIISTGKRNIQSVIQTNGSLLKSKKELMINLLPYVSELRISFDAGSEDTYKQTRVGGDWNRLLDNTEFIIDLIKQHKFNTRVYADFVVQKNNYKDLPLFATICRRLGVQMNIQKMWNWGTWDDTTFLDMNVYNPNHAEYSELQEYFKIAGLPIAKI